MTVKFGGKTPLADHGAGIWDASRNYMRIMLRDLVTEARLGLHPWEQHSERPTRLVINIDMFASIEGDLGAEHEAGIVDYDHIHAALRAWPARPHTRLIETLLHELVGLCFDSARVEACRVSILKPDIFNDAAAAGVEAYIRRDQYGRAER